MNRFLHKVYGKDFALAVTLTFCACSITSFMQVLQVIFVARVINGIGEGWEIEWRYFLVICGCFLSYVIMQAAGDYLSGHYSNRFMHRLRHAVTQSICKIGYDEIEKFETGDVLSVVTNDFDNLNQWLKSIFSLGYIPMKVGFAVAVCVMASWQITLALFIFVPLAAVIPIILSKDLYSMNLRLKESNGRVNAYFVNAINFTHIVKTYCLNPLFEKNNDELLADRSDKKYEVKRKNHFIHFFGVAYGHFITIVMLVLGTVLIINKSILLGDLFTITLLGGIVGEGLNQIVALPGEYHSARSAQTRVEALMNKRQDADEAPEDDAPIADEGSDVVFAFQDVCFSYDDGANILSDISFEILRGEKVAIVGRSGCGKTTLFKLMCGLYQANQGRMLFCGRDFTSLSKGTLTASLAVMPQEIVMFPGTIHRNISLANPTADADAVLNACRKAQIHDFVMGLPNGYETNPTLFGKSFSRGQMQRFSLARTLLKDSKVLLLDEPTSALDFSLSRLVMRELLGSAPEKTVVMITHNTASLAEFDRVLFIHEGYVAGIGSHAELCACCDEYRAFLTQEVVGCA